MMTECEKKTGQWPDVLDKRDFNKMIKLCLQGEMEKRYGHEIKSLIKTPAFRSAANELQSGTID